MTTAIYASLSAFLIVWLSLKVIGVRHRRKVSLGDGSEPELVKAMAAQSNALEYLPISLILLFVIEFNGGHLWLIHGLGIALLIGRVIHARAILSDDLDQRVLGMKITFWVILTLAAVNLFYLPWESLLTLATTLPF